MIRGHDERRSQKSLLCLKWPPVPSDLMTWIATYAIQKVKLALGVHTVKVFTQVKTLHIFSQHNRDRHCMQLGSYGLDSVQTTMYSNLYWLTKVNFTATLNVENGKIPKVCGVFFVV